MKKATFYWVTKCFPAIGNEQDNRDSHQGAIHARMVSSQNSPALSLEENAYEGSDELLEAIKREKRVEETQSDDHLGESRGMD